MRMSALLATAAAATVALSPLAGGAQTRGGKPKTVQMRADHLRDPAAKLCMPKSVLGKPPAGTPNTICQTQAEWTAAGITIVPR